MRALRTLALSACAAAALASSAGAVRPIRPNAPEFPEGAAWVNSKPLTLKSLRGKRVVLVSFLNASNIHSIRASAKLNDWWDRYALHGLMVVGVHDSDFDFDRDPGEVRRGLKRMGVRFPVVLDSGRRLWTAYANEGWPARYLIDHKGRIVHDRLGEGGDREFEQELLAALGRFNGYEPPEDYRIPEDPRRAECGLATDPFYLGARRGREVLPVRPVRIKAVLASREGEPSRTGEWTSEPDAYRFEGKDHSGFSSYLQVIYQGAEAFAVLGRTGPSPVDVYLKQDDLWLHSGNAGADVQWDAQGRSFVLVDEPRLYRLSANKRQDAHELRLYPGARGLGAYGFEFSDFCQAGEAR